MSDYPIPPLRKASLATLAMIGAALPLAMLAVFLNTDDRGEATLISLVMVLVALAVAGFMVSSVRRRRVSFDGRELVVASTMYTRRLTLDQLDLDGARVVSLEQSPELRPLIRLNGFALFGFSSGHYLLRDRRRAFVLLTRRDRVLAIPERDGPVLLLSLEHPQRLLDDLRKASPSKGSESRL